MKAVHFVTCIALCLASTLALAQSNPVPFVNQPLVPDATAPGGPDFTLTVNGTGFVNGANVNWNGVALATTFVNQSQLTATVPAANIATAGTASVTVSNPVPGGGTSNIQYFSVANPILYQSLGTEIDFESDGEGSSSVVADFNRDGLPDMATATGDGARILLGVGDGSFSPQAFLSWANQSSYVLFLIAADLNADGKQDIAAAAANAGGVLLALGNGDGTLRSAMSLSSPQGAQKATGLAVADLTGDGKLDIVALFDNRDTNQEFVAVYPGNGNGTFAASIVTTLNDFASHMTIGDFNADGKLDVATDHYMLLGNGDGTFQAPIAYDSPANFKVIAADVNLDGKLDLVSLIDGGGVTDFVVLLGNGDGTFQNVAAAGGPGGDPYDMAAADLNGDGYIDLVVSYDEGGGNNHIGSWLGTGNGSFLGGGADQLVGIGSIDQVLIGDFNLDGLPDIAGWGGGIFNNLNLEVLLQGETAGATLSPLVISFSDPQAPGTTSPPQPVTLTNNGTVNLAISSINVTGSNAGDFSQTNTCGLSLVAGASCQINVTFTPVAGGARSATLTVTDSAPSGVQTVPLNGTANDFQLGPNSDTSQTVIAGQAANYSVAVSSILGFDKTVALTCSGAPPGATCTVTPASVQTDPQGGPVTANVAVVTTAPSGGFTQGVGGPPASWWVIALGGTAVLALMLMASWTNRRRWSPQFRYALTLLCLVSIGSWVACGGGSGGGGGGGTGTGTYTLAVTGTYTSGGVTVNHNTKFTLVVK